MTGRTPGACGQMDAQPRDHLPEWQGADVSPLDWRFIGIDPLRRMTLTSRGAFGIARAANDNWGPQSWGDWAISLVLTVIIATAMCVAAVALIAALYIAKSAAGIDLFTGHSFLHDWLYSRA